MARAERTTKSLHDLAACLEASAEEFGHLAQRARTLADSASTGRPLGDLVAAEVRPLLITRMTSLLDELGDAAAEVRRAEAQQLVGEGLSQSRIAELFGVTRQRVSALLAPPPPPGARQAKRPRG